MTQIKTKILVLMCILSMSLSVTWAKVKNDDALTLDLVENTAEVPVQSIQNFVQIYGIVKANYVAEKSDDALFQQAIEGLVNGLDPYSRYLSPEEYKQLLEYTEGDLASTDFDLNFDSQQKKWLIAGLKGNEDSAKLKLKNGMPVFKIDGQELLKLNTDQVYNLLTGPVGSRLSLQLTESDQPISIVRNKKVETDVYAQLLSDQVLVINVKVFQQDTANQIKNIIEQYSENNRLKAILIDLRNNPGGLLSAAVESADLFLSKGIIVSTKSRSEGDQQFQALANLDIQDFKLGILINQRSASAAEVFTAALQDQGRAWVIGEKSYGKGVVQKLFPLSNGAALQMTVSHYYTPKGKMIEGVGITPNQIYAHPKDMKDEVYVEQVADLLLKKK